MSQKRPGIDELQTRLGYRFVTIGLLAEALIHSSAKTGNGGRDNERLEFLGDRVLGVTVAALLFERMPDATEAQFARQYNQLVRESACVAVASALDLGSRIVMAPSEARSGGRRKDVILADACEAILGAVFVDGGFEAAEAVVRKLWAPLLATEKPVLPDAKTALQEYAQGLRLGLPRYMELDRSGADHAPQFVVEVTVEGLDPARGSGTSLKKAQQAAAEIFLVREAIWPTGHPGD